MISIIIPAHNEANVISQTLDSLYPGTTSEEFDVIVVCNGCTDNTEKIVSGYTGVKCLSTQIPSKYNALNIGDSAAQGYPRIYLDADIVLSPDSVRSLASALSTDDILAASPGFQMDFSGSSFVVRAYYEIWQKLPYVQKGMMGSGVYALSESGRKRFENFPPIIADDGYVRALFKEYERTIVDSAVSVVRAPVNAWGLIKIKTRSRLGVYQLHELYPELVGNEEKAYGYALSELLPQIELWPKIFIYLAINLVSRFRANRQRFDIIAAGWERDESRRI